MKKILYAYKRINGVESEQFDWTNNQHSPKEKDPAAATTRSVEK